MFFRCQVSVSSERLSVELTTDHLIAVVHLLPRRSGPGIATPKLLCCRLQELEADDAVAVVAPVDRW